ncbi:MAG: NAD-dependent epimerase/dehydratase family protein [Chloroflexi bacterium]|nr:NAD-dependent epimerase/dehydratase family protein [Chloroflexota bacterium]
MKILVTGGAGFIGSHIVDALIDSGHEVAVVDDLSTGFERNVHRRARFFRLDIRDAALGGLFEELRPDAVFHEAAHTVVTRSITDPAYDAGVNILGSLNVIAAAVRSGVKRFVYASSCAAYGPPRYAPVDEAHPLDPLCPYGVSKHTIEHYLLLNHGLYSLSFAALRYANVYGPRQNPAGEGGVVAIFAGLMLAGGRPVIFGNGDKTRDYVYVGDVVRANLLALEAASCGVFNIGTGVRTSDREVFDTLSRELGYAAIPDYAAERPGEIRHIYLACDKACNELGWRAATTFSEGIRRAAEYYRAALPPVKQDRGGLQINRPGLQAWLRRDA